jgi:hypothetical protein
MNYDYSTTIPPITSPDKHGTAVKKAINEYCCDTSSDCQSKDTPPNIVNCENTGIKKDIKRKILVFYVYNMTTYGLRYCDGG